MNAQEILETVAKHLFEQGKKATGVCGNACLYRAPDGTKCAAGALIRDEDYDEEFEGCSFESHMTPHINVEHKELISSLQFVHDSNSSWVSSNTMRWSIIGVAAQYKLDAGFVQQLSFKDR